MRQKKFRYAVDTASFQRIREDGKVYVDKTEYIYNLVQNYQYVFLARPRRFGKSLMCNTLNAYFSAKKELFEGLKIMELEKEWKKYPVLHFTMSGLKNLPVRLSQTKLESLLRDYEKIYGKNETSVTPGDRFRDLIRNAYEQTGQKAVVILDEYDSPILQLMYQPDQLVEMRSLLREFYQVLKDEDNNLRFVFITGVTKFSQLSIFSELNNLRQISMLDEYSGICGITQTELDTFMRPCIEEYAENMGVTTEEAYALLKKNYDGYHFSRNSEDVYAPFSLLRAIDDNTTDYYWFESGTMSSLVEHLNHFPEFNPLDYDGVRVSLNQFNVPCENAKTPIPLLYQSGYLSIDTYDKDFEEFILHFPNREVRQGMVYGMANYLIDDNGIDRDASIVKMARSLVNGDLSTALTVLRAYIASLPYDIITKKEWMAKRSREGFYKMLMYIIFSLLNSKIDTEVKSILGRADVVVKTKNDIYVLELKVDKSVDEALEQIESKDYAIQYTADGRKITKCGVTISTEARNIVHWRTVSESGEVVDEQDFRQQE
ncbi:MAG: AAA family ATPase, partial [Muribaculaceae bacterium]